MNLWLTAKDIIWNLEISEKFEVVLYKTYYLPILTHGAWRRDLRCKQITCKWRFKFMWNTLKWTRNDKIWNQDIRQNLKGRNITEKWKVRPKAKWRGHVRIGTQKQVNAHWYKGSKYLWEKGECFVIRMTHPGSTVSGWQWFLLLPWIAYCDIIVYEWRMSFFCLYLQWDYYIFGLDSNLDFQIPTPAHPLYTKTGIHCSSELFTYLLCKLQWIQ